MNIGRFFLFISINFVALAIGGLTTSKGVPSDWYSNLDKAPWTPPGWIFGAAWTLIMVCFGIYMALLWVKLQTKRKLILLFALQFILNILWNSLFFQWNLIFIAMVEIILLTGLIFYITYTYRKEMRFSTIWIVPYLLWMCIATSLNTYIYLFN